MVCTVSISKHEYLPVNILENQDILIFGGFESKTKFEVWHILLRSSMVYLVPCDLQLHRAYCSTSNRVLTVEYLLS